MEKITDAYVRARYGKDLPQANVDRIRTAMELYEDNHWWESVDPVQVAMYQIFEDILITDFSTFHKGLEILVGRPVTHELGLNIEGVRKEARLGIERIKKGIETSSGYKQEAVIRSIKLLEDYCRKTGKQFLQVNLTKAQERDKNGIDRSGEDGWLTKYSSD